MFDKITHEPGTKLAVLPLETEADQTYYFVKDYERLCPSSSECYKFIRTFTGKVFFFSLGLVVANTF